MFSLFRKLSKEQKSMLATCFFAFFMNGTLSLMLGSILPDMKATFRLTDVQSGFLLTAHSAGNLIAGFTSGLLPLFLGRRRSIVFLILFTVLGYGLMSLSGNLFFLILCFAFTGIGRGGVTNFTNATANKISGGSPVATNLLHSFFAVGAFTAPLLFLLLSNFAGWQSPTFYVAFLAVSAAAMFGRLRFEDNNPNRADKDQSTLIFLKNPSFLILVAMMFFYLCAEYSINGWLVTYLQNKPALALAFPQNTDASIKAYSQTMATLLWMLILAGRLTCAFLSTKIPQKKLMLAASIGAACFFALMLYGNSIALVTLSIVGLGFCMAGICPMIYSDAGIFTNAYPMATSTLLAVGSAGAILMPSIVGLTASAFGFTGGMSIIFAAILLLLVFAALNLTVRTRTPGNVSIAKQR